MNTRFLLRVFATSALAMTAAGCTQPDVVAEVGHRRINRQALSLFRANSSAPAGEALDALIARERLAEAAAEAGLARQPEIAARLEAAEREVLAQAYLEQRLAKVGDADVQARFDQHKASLAARQLQLAHIYVALPSSADAETVSRAETKANGAWARLSAGEDFGAIAKDVSEDTATAATGGELGVVREGAVAKEIFDAAAQLEAGGFSKPVRTAFGLHLLKALSPLQTVAPTLENARGQILAALRREAEAELRTELEHSISVKTFPEHLNNVAATKEAAR